MTENQDQEIKPWYLSKAIWGGVVAGAAGVAGLFGYIIDPDTQAQMTEVLLSITALVGGVIAIIGRVRASKKVG